jgi:hypothetical protein
MMTDQQILELEKLKELARNGSVSIFEYAVMVFPLLAKTDAFSLNLKVKKLTQSETEELRKQGVAV